jgi:hypothetical protein
MLFNDHIDKETLRIESVFLTRYGALIIHGHASFSW